MYQPQNTEKEYPPLHLDDKRVRIQRTERGSRIYATDQDGNETTLTLAEQCEAATYMTTLFHTELCEMPVEKHPYLFLGLAASLQRLLSDELIRMKRIQISSERITKNIEPIHTTSKSFKDMTLDEFNEFFKQEN